MNVVDSISLSKAARSPNGQKLMLADLVREYKDEVEAAGGEPVNIWNETVENLPLGYYLHQNSFQCYLIKIEADGPEGYHTVNRGFIQLLPQIKLEG